MADTTSTSLTIRDMDNADLPVVHCLYNDTVVQTTGLETRVMSRQEFSQSVRGEKTLLACRDETVVGFASVWVPDRFVHHLYIEAVCQGQGIGPALLAACGERFGGPLNLKCAVANTRASAFYDRQGWVVRSQGMGTEGPYLHYWQW